MEGKPKEELYDAILEVSAFSRQCLIDASELQEKIPGQSFRAFLHASATEHYLELLEHNNFMIFSSAVNRPSYIELPIRVYQNCRNKRFLKSL